MAEEVAMEDAASAKKRTIFRSPGTASSPDLATLMKRGKDAKGKGSPAKGMSTSASQASVRDRSVSTVMSTDDSRSIASGSTERMTTISETSTVRRQNSDDGFKVGPDFDCADARACATGRGVCWEGCLG
jgi:hypothetical protein